MISKVGPLQTDFLLAILLAVCAFPCHAEETSLPWDTAEYYSVALCGGILSVSIFFFIYSHLKVKKNQPILITAFNELSAYLILDSRFRIVRSNNEFKKLNGYDIKDISGLNPFPSIVFTHSYKEKKEIIASLSKHSCWQGELSTIHKDGYVQTQLVKIQLVCAENYNQRFYLIAFVDISEQKRVEHQLRLLSEKDPLTGIWNRRKFDQELRTFCKFCTRYPESSSGCLAIIDIDHFKLINDKLGHDTGDHVLQAVASKLKSHLRETDIIARVGGEEFAVILHQTSLIDAQDTLDRLRLSISENTAIPCSVSCGITDITSQPEDVYKRADVALYDAKSSGRDTVTVLESTNLSEQPLSKYPQYSA